MHWRLNDAFMGFDPVSDESVLILFGNI